MGQTTKTNDEEILHVLIRQRCGSAFSSNLDGFAQPAMVGTRSATVRGRLRSPDSFLSGNSAHWRVARVRRYLVCFRYAADTQPRDESPRLDFRSNRVAVTHRGSGARSW